MSMPRHFDVNRVPLVAIDGATLRMRRYVGRECTHEADLVGYTVADARQAVAMVDLFREDPVRAFRQSPAVEPMDQPVPA
jgi:hypothetical protein